MIVAGGRWCRLVIGGGVSVGAIWGVRHGNGPSHTPDGVNIRARWAPPLVCDGGGRR